MAHMFQLDELHADQCGRNIIAQKAPVIRANENLNIFRIISSQGQIFTKMGKKPENWLYLGGYFTYRLHTWFQGTTQ